MNKRRLLTKISAFYFAVAILLSVNLLAFAAGSAVQFSWLNYYSGGFILIPKSFTLINTRDASLSEGFIYEYYNYKQQMSLVTTESNVSSWGGSSEMLLNNYNQLLEKMPKAVYYDYSEKEFTLSGYSGNNIYYIRYILDHGTLYTIEFNYPTANRKVCDMYVESICDSFSATGFQKGDGVAERPSPADLDVINADINYPNYNWMYLSEYETAVVSHNKAVYCFKDPDTDVWRKGNYYAVRQGAAVTVLAKSEGYACVIINGTDNAGWINQKYLKADNSGKTQVSANGNYSPLSDGEYACVINWSLNPRLSDYSLSFNIGSKTYTFPVSSQADIRVYGWGQDGYHEIEYTCAELDGDRYNNHYNFVSGNSSDASITIDGGVISSVSILYAE